MFDLSLDDVQSSLKKMLGEYAQKRLRSAAADAENARAVPEGVLVELHQMGVLNPVDQQYGGQGLFDPVTWLLSLEELAVGDPGIAFHVASSSQAGFLLNVGQNADARRQYLPRLASDRAVRTSVWVFEDFGRGLTELQCVAHRCRGGWSLTGRKTSVLAPGRADITVLVAVDAESGGLLAFASGDEINSRVVVERDDRELGKCGMLAVHTGCVSFQGLQLPDTALVARAGDATALHRVLAMYRLSLAAVAIGTAQAAFAYAVDYAKERVAFGKRIADYQGVSFPLANLAMAIQAARLGVWEAASLLESTADLDTLDKVGARVLVDAARVAVRATRDSINTLGGHGFLTDHPVERWYRAAITLVAVDFDPLLVDLDV